MSYRLTLGLLAVLIALGGVVYYVQTGAATPTPTPAGQAVVFKLLATDVSSLEATGQGKTVQVVRDGDTMNWLLKKPEEAKADQIRVDGLVSRLAALSATKTIAATSGLGEFGLDQPKVEAKLTTKSGQVSTLLLGDQSPDKSGYYAKLPDNATVYLIPVAVGSDLSQLITNPPKATPTPAPLVVPTLPPLGTPTPFGAPPAAPTAAAAATSPSPAPTAAAATTPPPAPTAAAAPTVGGTATP